MSKTVEKQTNDEAQKLRQEELQQTIADLGGTYQNIRFLGSGGLGNIYMAYKTGLNVDVVIKKVKGKYKNRVNERGEADILKTLRHRYLPGIYDIIESPSGYVYTVMDFVPGDTLQNYVKQNGPVEQKKAYRWLCQLCEVTAYLQEQKIPIIHCDIKPSNIMIKPEGNICLIDFNTSLIYDGEVKALGATPGYAAPEQYTKEGLKKQAGATADGGEVSSFSNGTDHSPSSESNGSSFGTARTQRAGTYGEISLRTDVYSIGATAYYMLSGKKPAHALDDGVPLKDLHLPISKALVEVITCAMNKPQAQRYPDAEHMYQALLHVTETDWRYKKNKQIRIVFLAAELSLAGLGVCLIVAGKAKMKAEKDAKYTYYISEAESAEKSFDEDRMNECLAQAMELYPDRPEAYYRQADWCFLQGDYEECENQAEYIMGSKTDGADPILLGEICDLGARSCDQLEDYEGAVSWWQKAVEYDKENASYYCDCANRQLELGQQEEAEKTVEQMEAEVPDIESDPAGYLANALLSVFDEDLEGAMDFLTEGASITDDPAQLGRIARLSSLVIEKAESDVDEMEIEDLVDVNTNLNTEISVMENGVELIDQILDRIDDSRRNIIRSYAGDAAIRVSGAFDSICMSYSYLYSATVESDYELAKQYSELAIQYHEESISYGEKAAGYYKEMIASGQDSYSVQMGYAQAMLRMWDFDGAKDILLDLADKYPDNYVTYKWLAELYYLNPDKDIANNPVYDTAIDYFDKANELYEKAERNGTTDPEMADLENKLSGYR